MLWLNKKFTFIYLFKLPPPIFFVSDIISKIGTMLLDLDLLHNLCQNTWRCLKCGIFMPENQMCSIVIVNEDEIKLEGG